MSTSLDLASSNHDVSRQRPPVVDAPLTPRSTRVGFLSSALPTPCGLATFTAALGGSMAQRGLDVGVIRVMDTLDDDDATGDDLPVWGRLVALESSSRRAAVRALNDCDVVVVQHEYGLYGGQDGSEVVRVLEGVVVPVITILHTILASPTRHQRDVLNEVIRRSHDVVVMSTYAATTLRAANFIGATPVHVIAHGAQAVLDEKRTLVNETPEVLSWGLLGPGKGIEWVIDALAMLKDCRPLPHYTIAGRTHPKVLARQGDAYRDSLRRRVEANGVGPMVTFDDSYRDLASLQRLIQQADLVVLPYDSLDQATSGVLVDAVAAGRPVVATAFPHALELLSSGAGIIVPQRNPPALAAAIRSVLEDPDRASAMASAARARAPELSWDAVARHFGDLVTNCQRVGS